MTLSVPSYVIPGTYLENLQWLEANSAIRHVELLFFIFDEEASTLLSRELAGLREYSEAFRFTAHLPDRLVPGHERLVENLAGFVDAFVTHPPPPVKDQSDFVSLINAWRRRYGVDRFLLENTRLSWFEPTDSAFLDSTLGSPHVCADLGHLLLEGVDPVTWTGHYADRITEIHLHGLSEGRDHVSFNGSEEWFNRMEPFFRIFQGIAEIELFSWADLQPALLALGRF
ncbi:MAG: AP endonuclease [Spirochaetales bacterium]|nr:MAG: AP endonuclease [Spirochaetales bacterium]